MSVRNDTPEPSHRYEHRRHTVFDRVLAGLSLPLAVLFSVVPGAVVDNDGSGSLSLAFRLLVPDARARAEPAEFLDLEGDYPWLGVFVAAGLVVVPAATALLVLFRRRWPEHLLVFAIATLVLFANIWPAAVGLYTYAAWFNNRRRLAVWCAVATVGVVVGISALWGAIPWILLSVVVPVSLGLWIGTRRLLIANLRERAEQAEREQRLLAERAAEAERTRIAREMHDVVAHRVSLMVVHAGGLEVSASDPQVVETAEVIRTTGREALAELRDVLGVLRGNSADLPLTSPQPVLTDVARLIEGWRSAGVDVTFEVAGSHRRVSEQVERTIYRVIQESLTNAGKHAPGAAIRVGLDYHDGWVNMDVVNALVDSAGEHVETQPSGYGLAGLQERIVLTGGELTAGRDGQGGWRVHATLPVDADDGGAGS